MHDPSPTIPIVLVAYGVLRPESRRVYDHIEGFLRDRLPTHPLEWAFSSRIIVERMRERGEAIQRPEEVLARLRDHPRPTLVQSLHVVPGQEYHQLQALVEATPGAMTGRPLLFDEGDLEDVVDLLGLEVMPDRPNVVVCHGNDRHPEYNARYVQLARRLETEHSNVVVASLEGEPGPGRLLEVQAQAAAAGAVHFIPLLLVAGSHVLEDVMGEQADSWRNRIGVKECSCSPPLGYNDAVLEIYHRHIETGLHTLADQPGPEGP